MKTVLQKLDVPVGVIAVDLDGTLAEYDGWQGADHIGKPIYPMVKKLREKMKEGYEIWIFTARASDEKAIPHVKAWLKKYRLPDWKITNQKDYSVTEFWDDRCRQVVANTGLFVDEVKEQYPSTIMGPGTITPPINH